MRRLGQPSEVADAIYFLCSEKSSYISGTEIEVNGAQHV
jgi:NAD(P)-dependent dehydrogenase (short-subunit alcohol dehydrogenase family)